MYQLFRRLWSNDRRTVNKPLAETIRDPQILLCSICADETDAMLLAQDKAIYQSYFKNTSEHQATGVRDFLDYIQGRSFDIVHLMARIEPDGTIDGAPTDELLRQLALRDVKFVIFARNLPRESYGKAFHADKTSSLRVDYIVTVDRKGENFGNFFRQLFDCVANGETLLRAYVKIAPQAPGPWMDNLPDTYFVFPRGDLLFIP